MEEKKWLSSISESDWQNIVMFIGNKCVFTSWGHHSNKNIIDHFK